MFVNLTITNFFFNAGDLSPAIRNSVQSTIVVVALATLALLYRNLTPSFPTLSTEDAFNNQGLKNFSYKKDVARFMAQWFLTKKKDSKEEDSIKMEKIREEIFHYSSYTIQIAALYKEKFLKKRKDLDKETYTPSIEFTALILAIQTAVDLEILDLKSINEVFPIIEDIYKYEKPSFIQFSRKNLTKDFKTLVIPKKKLFEMQTQFLKTLDWNLGLNEIDFKDGTLLLNKFS